MELVAVVIYKLSSQNVMPESEMAPGDMEMRKTFVFTGGTVGTSALLRDSRFVR